MTNIRTLALGAVLAIGISSVAGAQSTQGTEKSKAPAAHEGRPHDRGMRDHGMRDHGMRGMRMGGHALKGIKLTDAQKEQIKSINEKYRSEFEAKHPGMEKGHGTGARPDSAARAQMMAEHMQIEQRRSAEIRSVLTAEQQTTYDANIARMREKESAWREKHGAKGYKKGH